MVGWRKTLAFNNGLKRFVDSYQWATPLREAYRLLARLGGERRGRPPSISGDDALHDFIELEARARILTRGSVPALLKHQKIRLISEEGKRSRLNRPDRERLKKRHQIGRTDFEFWKSLRHHYGAPGQKPRPADGGDDDPKYRELVQRLEQRIAELTENRMELFFLRRS